VKSKQLKTDTVRKRGSRARFRDVGGSAKTRRTRGRRVSEIVIVLCAVVAVLVAADA